MKKCYLILADGHIFEGTRFGAEGTVAGELVFNTGVVGYEANLTDPNNYGQIVLQTFPMIGNYGVIPEDLEGKKTHLTGYVVREWCDSPSNFRCKGTLDEYLKAQGVVGMYGVDTREITRIIRDNGVMAAKITDEIGDAADLASYAVKGAVEAVACRKKTVFAARGEKKYAVAAVHYGTAGNLIDQLTERGCEVTVFPYDTKAEEILSDSFDGLLLTDGPGDPAENTACIGEIRKLLGAKPVFAVGLSHQMLAIAAGAKTYKLTYGHRGGNQPVKRIADGRTYITTQNHGYAVDAAVLPEGAEESYVNANDHTCEGVTYAAQNAFSVQFHPTACKGPQDTTFLYEAFTALMDAAKKQ